jgi:hypothetical protein
MTSLSRRELFAADPTDFVGLRDRLVKELKAAGEKDEAAAVRALRRPSVAVWSLNRVAHDDAGLVGDLLDAAAQARTAQVEALGAGDAAGLRTAMAARRDALAKVARAARGVVDASGRSGDAQDRDIEDALSVLVTSDRLDEQFRAGELTAVTAAPDDSSDLLEALASSVPATKPGRKAAPKPSGPSPALVAARRDLDKARTGVERARAKFDAAREALDVAEHALTEAEQRVVELED